MSLETKLVLCVVFGIWTVAGGWVGYTYMSSIRGTRYRMSGLRRFCCGPLFWAFGLVIRFKNLKDTGKWEI